MYKRGEVVICRTYVGLEEAMRGMPACGRRPSRAENSETERILTQKKKNSEGCEVRTRADNRPDDLKSPALDHSANPPIIVDFLLPRDKSY